MNTTLITNFVLATVAILNPIGKIPIWIKLTADLDSSTRRRLGVWITLTVVALLCGAFVVGRPMLAGLGIDLAAFRLAGGIIVLLLGISMVRGEIDLGGSARQDDDGEQEIVSTRFRNIVVPFAMPILAGPGALSTMIIYEAQAGGWVDYGVMLGVIVVACVLLLTFLVAAEYVQHLVGDVGLELATRLFGLLLTAIAMQFIVEGLGEIFPKWLDWTSPIKDDIDEQAGS